MAQHVERSTCLLSLLTCLLALGCERGGDPGSGSGAVAVADHPPARIASRTVLGDELLWELGPQVQARVVGLSPMVDDPRYSLVARSWPASTPRLGRNPEQLLALAPELLILASFSDVEYRAALEGSSVELLVLDDFSGFAGYRSNLARIGAAVGAVEQAQALRARFDQRLAAVEARRPAPGQRPSVICWDYGYVPGLHTSFDDAASAAGFRNLAAANGLDGHQRLDAEQLIDWGPAWLVIGCGEQSCAQARSKLAEEPGLGSLAALEAGRVIAIEAPYLATTGEGMLELAERLQGPLLAGAPP